MSARLPTSTSIPLRRLRVITPGPPCVSSRAAEMSCHGRRQTSASLWPGGSEKGSNFAFCTGSGNNSRPVARCAFDASIDAHVPDCKRHPVERGTAYVPTASAILDRFLQHAHLIAITGKSHRLKDTLLAKTGARFSLAAVANMATVLSHRSCASSQPSDSASMPNGIPK